VEVEVTGLFPDRAWAKAIRIEVKLLENATYLGNAQVLRMFRGQTLLSPVILPLIGYVPFIVQPRSVIVTEKSALHSRRARGVNRRSSAWPHYARGSVPIDVTVERSRSGCENTFGLLTTL